MTGSRSESSLRGLEKIAARLRFGALSSRAARYGLSAVVVAVALGVRFALHGVLGERLAFGIFFPATLLAAWLGGLGPGLLALVLGYMLEDFFFVPPLRTLLPHGPEQYLSAVLYLFSGFFGIAIIEKLRIINERLVLSDHLAAELEQRVAERTASLQESLRSLEGMVYHLAHDLRAPARHMHGFTQILLHKYGANLDAFGQQCARNILDSSTRMDRLIGDLLAFGRIGYKDLDWTSVSLREVFDNAIVALHPEIHSRHAEIQLAEPLPTVRADAKLLGKILYNLLDNALKFVPAGTAPRVNIWAEERNGALRVNIQDNGIGIAPEHQEKIFGIFQRLHSQAEFPGTGIGLAIVRQAMERMHGAVGLDSPSGQGSRFWLELAPALDDSAGFLPATSENSVVLVHGGAEHGERSKTHKASRRMECGDKGSPRRQLAQGGLCRARPASEGTRACESGMPPIKKRQ
ncbi:MAG: hypothetical protein C5B50_19120 [Verrucomicrobia bacterium]|nr:MAG: hypothetical protein C5B50_19120 [Verrucomicrobiota bacterium]